MIVTVTCPGCWQPTAFEIAEWEGDVEQVEDCQVCCRSLLVRARLSPVPLGADNDDNVGDDRDVMFGEPEVDVEVALNE